MNPLIIKVCGIVHPDDAVSAAKSGADCIGILFSPKSKRFVETPLAREIAEAASENGATPIGVFVDESYDQIMEILAKTGIKRIQLHGPSARSSLKLLPSFVEPIFVTNLDQRGEPVDTCYEGQIEDSMRKFQTHYFLYDSSNPGSGTSFPWKTFSNKGKNRPWILAGGLNSENIQEAIEICDPDGVDVSTGVSDLSSPKGLRKDPKRMELFIKIARSVKRSLP